MLSSMRAYPGDTLWVLAYAVFYFAAKNDVASGCIFFVAGRILLIQTGLALSNHFFVKSLFSLSNNLLLLNMEKNFVYKKR